MARGRTVAIQTCPPRASDRSAAPELGIEAQAPVELLQGGEKCRPVAAIAGRFGQREQPLSHPLGSYRDATVFARLRPSVGVSAVTVSFGPAKVAATICEMPGTRISGHRTQRTDCVSPRSRTSRHA